jgi:hypothetical protein
MRPQEIISGQTDLVRLRPPLQPRIGRPDSSGTPGPGAYSLCTKPFGDGPRFTLKGRHEITAEPTGEFSELSVSKTKRLPTRKVRASKRKERPPEKEWPGPGQYSPNIEAVRPKAPSVRIGNRQREKVTEKGGGYIDLGSTLTTKGCTIGCRDRRDLIQIWEQQHRPVFVD